MQTDERTIELIHAAVDGELRPGEQADLDALLESSPQAAGLHDGLVRLRDQLAADPSAEMPQGLSERILENTAARSTLPKLLASLFSPFQSATAGLAFAAGLLLTVTVYEWTPVQNRDLDPRSLSGALVRPPAVEAAYEVDAYDIHQPGLGGRVVLERLPQGLLLSLQLEAEQPLEAIIATGDDGPGIGGIFAGVQDGVLRGVSLDTTGGKLRVEEPGRQVISVMLPDDPASPGAPRTITINISSQGRPVHSGSLAG